MYSSACLTGLSLLVLSLLHHGVSVAANLSLDNKQIRNYFGECFAKRLKLSCITEKASIAIEESMDTDLQLLPGIVLVRNDLALENSTGREDKYGIDRLTSAVSKFLDSHSLTMETADEARARRRRRYGLLLPLLGAMGITGAMMMKGIAVIAGKALMVSKMALMLISIIGLKKLFSKDDEKSETQVVQLHSMHDEHDRNLNTALYNIRHL